MLIDTLTFEIRDFTTGSFEQFAIPATEDSYAMVASHRSTRCIKFVKQFSFEKMTIPSFILETVVAEYLSTYALENELDEIDEMIGVFA